jgi:hypothetical protein
MLRLPRAALLNTVLLFTASLSIAAFPSSSQAHEGAQTLLHRRAEITRPQSAAEFAQGTLGVCQLYNLSGYAAVDATGHLVILSQYCSSQRATANPEGERFWQEFRTAASKETNAFVKTLEPEKVVAYGTTICPFLEHGGTVQELRQLQTDGTLPYGFETAVTTAAIHTYCPAYARLDR